MSEHPDGHPTLTFRGGGWLIALTVVAVLAVVVWAMAGVWSGRRPTGDGRTVESYGFALEPLLAEREFLVASGNPRDFLMAMDAPRTLAGSEVLAYNESQRRKYVVTTDRVAGVVVNGEARAYPLAVLNAHEVVNDTLGGVPIAVTFCPLTDSLLVFDRRIGGQPRLMRVSGLLYNSNLVMYDTPEDEAARAAATPSLWSQLGMRAIAGPAAAASGGAASGQPLQPVGTANISTWKSWFAAHPATTIILPDPASISRYKELSYARYCLTPKVGYPVRSLGPEVREAQSVEELVATHQQGAQPTRKTPAVRVLAGGAETAWTLPDLLARTNYQDGEWRTELGGVPLRVTVRRQPLSVMIDAPGGEPVTVIPQLWFALRAFAGER